MAISCRLASAGLAAAQAERHEAVGRRPDLARAPDVRAAPAARGTRLTGSGRARPCSRSSRLLASTGRRLAARRVHSAVSAANAASGSGVRVRRWARCNARARGRDRRCSTCFPIAAITPRSEARHDARGPSTPNGVMCTQTASGARAGIELMRAGDAGRVEHHVGVGEQRVELGIVGRERDHAACPRSTPGRRSRAARRPRAARPATTAAPRSPSTRRGAGRRVAAEIDDPTSFKQPLRHGWVLPLN